MEKFKMRGGRGRGRGSPAASALRGPRGGGVRDASRGAPGPAYHHQRSRAPTLGPYWAQQQQQLQMPPPPPPPWRQQHGRGRGGGPGIGGVGGGPNRANRGRLSNKPRRMSAPSSQAPADRASTSSDPLNLRWVAAESQRRDLAGLSPMPGDSALNSPIPDQSARIDKAGNGESAVTEVEEAGPSSVCQDSLTVTNVSCDPTAATIILSTNSMAATGCAVATTDQSIPPMPKTPTTQQSPQAAYSSPHFVPIYGNYRAHYGRQMRAGELNIGQMQDDRLQLLQPDWYTDKDVLDIGCNDGVFSLKIAESLGVRSLTGIDIDEELVQAAERNLRSRIREHGEEERARMTLRQEGFLPDPPAATDSAGHQRAGFPYNVKFLAANYVPESEAQLAKTEENKYDIIQAFSITKWIHLNWGDRGLKLFFRRAFRELKPDGKFIVEPQPYQSYKRTLLCPAHKHNYACNIALKPEQFKQFLERDVGFAHILSVWEQQERHGFQRPVLMCSKPTGQTPALGRDASQHNLRIFVPSHPLRGQLDPGPYCSESCDLFDMMMMESDEADLIQPPDGGNNLDGANGNKDGAEEANPGGGQCEEGVAEVAAPSGSY